MEEDGISDNLISKNLQIITSEATRVSKNIEKQISKHDPAGSISEPQEDVEGAVSNKAKGQEIYEGNGPFYYFFMFVVAPLVIVTLLAPIPMIAVGWSYLETCSKSFYPTWLIGGGGGILGFFVLLFMGACFCADGLVGGGFSLPCGSCAYSSSCFLLFLCFGFEVVWYFVGCYYIWAGEPGKTVLEIGDVYENGELQETEDPYKYEYSCRCLYYFVYTLIVLPLVLLAIFFIVISVAIVVRLIQLYKKMNSPGNIQTPAD